MFFVTSHQVVEWMRRPTSLHEIGKFAPWQCAKQHFESFEVVCDLPNSCKLPSTVLKSYRYLYTCFECPQQYPWLRNEFGIEWKCSKSNVRLILLCCLYIIRSSRIVPYLDIIVLFIVSIDVKLSFFKKIAFIS